MKDFYRELLSSYKVKPHGEGFILSTDIMYFGADHTFSFYIKHSDDCFIISDRGQTLSYLRENLDVDNLSAKIMDLLRRFGAVLDKGEIKAILPSYESNQTIRCLHNFIFTVGLIANIDLI